MLGGPFGPFFRQLAGTLGERGATIYRVNLHAADAVNWGLRRSDRFNGPHADWQRWISRYMTENAITDLAVYGDCQFYNRAALEAARWLGIERHVFESGYFRPDWITYEKNGVNDYSDLPRNAAALRREAEAAEGHMPHIEKIGIITPYHVMHAFADWIFDSLGWFAFSRYRWPYMHGPIRQALCSVRRAIRLKITKRRQNREIEEIRSDERPYFLALMQREGDSQILFHSSFASVSGFCEAVMQNFANNAPANARLVFKNHPLDPGIVNYEQRIADVARALNMEGRVSFIDGGNLAELAKEARGVVTINSTAGISTVQFGVPTITLGRGIYSMEGLTHQGELSGFWRNPLKPDAELFRVFHRVVLSRTQINGNYYSPRGRRIALEVCADRLMSSVRSEAPVDAAVQVANRG